MEFAFKGWDQGFNVMVMRMAELTSGVYSVAAEAPATLEELNAHVAQHKRITVSNLHMSQNVFGNDEANLAFRAWHDWTHWKYQTPFTLEGERKTYEHQLVDMMKVFGGPAPTTLRWAQMLYAEVIGQTEYKEKWGVFPANQMAFDLAYLTNPQAAVDFGIYHALDLRNVETNDNAAMIRHGIG